MRGAGDRDAAIAVLRLAIEKQPDALPPHLEIVPLLLDAGDLAGARAEADRALELDPRMAPMYALRGQAKWMSGDAEGAEADLARAAAEGARVPWAEVSLGKILREKGREEEAKGHFRNAIKWAPESRGGGGEGAAGRVKVAAGRGVRTSGTAPEVADELRRGRKTPGRLPCRPPCASSRSVPPRSRASGAPSCGRVRDPRRRR